ncbi:uncharacterized protein LOC119283472 [Triticum dicoccoides]|uniref:uncharacterized protein LOC119283472 n=1 Tax=Triticum dicoccoides TaxID=85692 RepID=UPI00188F6148|nr:uncharacterized protein LOC119283472 [Triticum dicoccoides]
MPRPWQRNRLDPEYTARLLSNGCTGMMESAMKKSLDNLLVAEEAGGHGDGNSASMVFVFGSVPLKTYLPDGDIDLTVIGNTSCGSTLIDDVYYILGSGEENGDAEFEVKDLEHIDAEVRLIKCTIGNIIVDISFNQTGGICAVSFLELVDRKVGKNHLFKRSIILIKGWCYYESRLLGAHHGLISTYALETLILYVFNLFHKSLHGPLEVLYRFLEYFSKFDWDKYCISLNGPVALSSLPNLIVEGLNVPSDDLLFDKEFLENSVQKASAPPRNSDARYSKFRVKCLNIIDPLKECNNLGRSVNRANFHRIRTAFSFGARKLGQILMLPPELIPDDIFAFFKNTLERNENGVRSDIDHVGAFHCQPFLGPSNQLLDGMSCMQISYKEEEKSRPRVSKKLAEHAVSVRINVPTQGGCFSGDDSFAPSTDLSARLSHCVRHEPNDHAYVFHENRNYVAPEMDGQESRYAAEAYMGDKSLIQPQHHAHYSSNILSSIHGSDLGLPKPGPTKMEKLIGTSLHVEEHLHPLSLLNLSDLSGDLESQLRCLRQVQYNLEYLFDEFSQSVQEASSDGKVDKDLFDILNRGILLSTDTALPGLLPPSYAETNGMKLSPVSSHSTEVSQQSQDEDNWDMPFQLNACGIDVPSNGLSPSYIADSDISVSWWHRSEAIPNMRETVGYIREKHMTSIGEKGKILINQPVKIKSNQATIPKRSFVPCQEQVAPDSGTKEISLSLGIGDGLNGYTLLGMKTTEKHSGHTRKEFVKPHYEARHTRSSYGDVGSNKTFFQKRNYDTGMKCARPVSAKYQSPEVEGTPDECTYMNNNLARNQSCNTPKGYGTNRRLASEPLKLQSSTRGRGFSKKNLPAKQKYDNHSGLPYSFVRDTKHAPNGQVATILTGSTKEVALNEELVENGTKPMPNVFIPRDSSWNNQRMLLAPSTCHPSVPVTKVYSQSGALETQPDRIIEFGSLGPFSLTSPSPKSNKASPKACADASALALQSYRASATQSRSSGFYRIGDEEQFPPLHARTR